MVFKNSVTKSLHFNFCVQAVGLHDEFQMELNSGTKQIWLCFHLHDPECQMINSENTATAQGQVECKTGNTNPLIVQFKIPQSDRLVERLLLHFVGIQPCDFIK